MENSVVKEVIFLEFIKLINLGAGEGQSSSSGRIGSRGNNGSRGSTGSGGTSFNRGGFENVGNSRGWLIF